MLIVRQMTPVPALWRGKGASTSTDAFCLPPSAHWHRRQKGIAAEENKESKDESRRTLFYIQLSRTSHGCCDGWSEEVWDSFDGVFLFVNIFRTSPLRPAASGMMLWERNQGQRKGILKVISVIIFFFPWESFPLTPPPRRLPIMLFPTMSEYITGSHHTMPWFSKEEKLFRSLWAHVLVETRACAPKDPQCKL